MTLPQSASEDSAPTGTRAALMDAAETLIAARGFSAVSVRDITQAAGANVAAVGYHFGSKQALTLAVFERRAVELSRERLDGLTAVMEGDAPSPQGVFKALLWPPLRWMQQGAGRRGAMSMLIRAHLDGQDELMERIFRDVSVLVRFRQALMQLDPTLSAQEVNTRLFFALGMEHEIILNLPRLATLEAKPVEALDVEDILERALERLTS